MKRVATGSGKEIKDDECHMNVGVGATGILKSGYTWEHCLRKGGKRKRLVDLVELEV